MIDLDLENIKHMWALWDFRQRFCLSKKYKCGEIKDEKKYDKNV